MSLFLFLLLMCLRLHGVFADREVVSVMEGDSVTLNTDVQTNQHYLITWYYNGIRIARIRGDLSYICTDVQCNEGNERFRGRLKLDHQTGSLTIMNIRITDSGEYTLEIISSRFISSEKIFRVSVHAFSDPDSGSDLSPFPSGIFVAVVVAVSVIVILLIVAVICCCKCRARRNADRTERSDQRDTFLMQTLSDSNLRH